MTDTLLKEEVFDLFLKIEEDDAVPKNIRNKVKVVSSSLKEDEKNVAFKINQALQELDDISEDINIPDYVRTQIWSIVSLLESAE